MNPKEFIRPIEKIINSPNQRLVGDLNTGYRLLSDEELKERNIVSSAIRQSLNSVYGVPINCSSRYPDKPLMPANDYDGDAISNYCSNDIAATSELYSNLRNTIKKVIFNDPATIIIWGNGDKTVVKCGEGDTFDPEKGMAMAIAKRFLGDKGNYYETFKKWLPKKEENKKKHAICSEKFMTLKEYCERHNITKNTAYRMIKNGDLHVKKDNKGHWIIPVFEYK